MDYPKRPRMFRFDYLPALFESNAGADHGAESLALLAAVVTAEDKGRYGDAAEFTDEELAKMLGLSLSSLSRRRAALKAAGLLAYTPGRKGVKGRYWVLDLPGGFPVSLTEKNRIPRQPDVESCKGPTEIPRQPDVESDRIPRQTDVESETHHIREPSKDTLKTRAASAASSVQETLFPSSDCQSTQPPSEKVSEPAAPPVAAEPDGPPVAPVAPGSTITPPDESEADPDEKTRQKRNTKRRERTDQEVSAFGEIFDTIQLLTGIPTGAPQCGRVAKLAWQIHDYRREPDGRQLRAGELKDRIGDVLTRFGLGYTITQIGGGRSIIPLHTIEQGWRWICEPPRGTVVNSTAGGNAATARAISDIHRAALAEKQAGGVHPILGRKKA